MRDIDGFVATDLDGTLMRTDRTVGSPDLETLRLLGTRGTTRVVATGRSLYSARLALAPDFPIDYLVFSTGAGVLAWDTQALLRGSSIEPEPLGEALAVLRQLGLSFMIHRAIPDNHYFWFHRDPSGRSGDFERRLARYEAFAEPWEWHREEAVLAARAEAKGSNSPLGGAVSQLVAIVDADRGELFEILRARLPGLAIEW